MKLSRRSFVGGALAAPFLAQPGFGQARGSVLRVIPHADLKNIDPIWTTAYISRNHGYMVYDTLFAMDKAQTPAADGRQVGDLGRRQDLDLRAARRPELPRRQAGDRGGLRRLADPLGQARRRWAS